VHWLIAGILFGMGLIMAPLVFRLTIPLLVWAAIAAAVIAVVLFSMEYPGPLILLLFLVGFGYLTRWIGKHDDQAAITAEEERRRKDRLALRRLLVRKRGLRLGLPCSRSRWRRPQVMPPPASCFLWPGRA
jgi:hypothetical protein